MSNNNGGLSGIELNEWREHEHKLARKRYNSRMKRSMLSRNALAAQMVVTGRGPKKPSEFPLPPFLTKPPTQRPNLNAEPYASQITRNILAMLSTVPVPAPAPAPPAPVGGAGAAAAAAASPATYENTSNFTALPNAVRSKSASYLSGAELNHLKPIKAKIARETAKIANPRNRKNKTRKH
jgi:hypothetical protein